jgi:hypothetical protein
MRREAEPAIDLPRDFVIHLQTVNVCVESLFVRALCHDDFPSELLVVRLVVQSNDPGWKALRFDQCQLLPLQDVLKERFSSP